MDDFWTTLASRCYMSREFTKTSMYKIAYGGCIDPWLDHILREEAALIRALPPTPR
jgi:hypothetical protein